MEIYGILLEIHKINENLWKPIQIYGNPCLGCAAELQVLGRRPNAEGQEPWIPAA